MEPLSLIIVVLAALNLLVNASSLGLAILRFGFDLRDSLERVERRTGGG